VGLSGRSAGKKEQAVAWGTETQIRAVKAVSVKRVIVMRVTVIRASAMKVG
jgi:hypothetical protein